MACETCGELLLPGERRICWECEMEDEFEQFDFEEPIGDFGEYDED